MKYSGEGSMENPQFPLRFVKASGQPVICHNAEELQMVMDDERRQFLWMILTALPLSILVVFLIVAFGP